MKEIEILKKGRKYFQCLVDGKYKCRLLIDDASEHLEPGKHVLELEDISVRSKYGTDLKFKVRGGSEPESVGVVTLCPEVYNKNLVDAAHQLGGSWDADAKCWVFSGIVSDKVDELAEVWESPLVPVEVEFEETIYGYKGPAFWAGFEIARAWDRDSGAKPAKGVSLVKGKVDSGGSRANWKTVVQEGTVVRLMVPEGLLPELLSDEFQEETGGKVTPLKMERGRVGG